MSKNLYDSQAVEELAVLFRQINTCQRMLRHAKEAKDAYADLVNRIMSTASAEEGQRLAEEALSLIYLVENEADIRSDLEDYLEKLRDNFGIELEVASNE